MKRLENFFEVLFRIGDSSIHAFWLFVKDHLIRLNTNNPGGVYAGIIAETQAKFTALTASMGEKTGDISGRISATGDMKQKRGLCDAFIRRHWGTIVGKWDKGTPTYLEFFPFGLGWYTKATKKTYPERIGHFVSACEAHLEELGAELVNEVKALRIAYQLAFDAQLGKKGEISSDIEAYADDFDIMALQLMKNIFTIGLESIQDLGQGKIYFDTSILRRPVSGGGSGQVRETIECLATEVVIPGPFSPAAYVDAQNTGKGKLLLYLAAHPTDPMPQSPYELLSNSRVEIPITQLGNPSDMYLMVHNPDEKFSGSLTIELREGA
jgi:hypothetical protein